MIIFIKSFFEIKCQHNVFNIQQGLAECQHNVSRYNRARQNPNTMYRISTRLGRMSTQRISDQQVWSGCQEVPQSSVGCQQTVFQFHRTRQDANTKYPSFTGLVRMSTQSIQVSQVSAVYQHNDLKFNRAWQAEKIKFCPEAFRKLDLNKRFMSYGTFGGGYNTRGRRN